jgi:hypothetical protein
MEQQPLVPDQKIENSPNFPQRSAAAAASISISISPMAPKRNTDNCGVDRRRQGHWLLSLMITAFYSQYSNTTRGNPRYLPAAAKEYQ